MNGHQSAGLLTRIFVDATPETTSTVSHVYTGVSFGTYLDNGFCDLFFIQRKLECYEASLSIDTGCHFYVGYAQAVVQNGSCINIHDLGVVYFQSYGLPGTTRYESWSPIPTLGVVSKSLSKDSGVPTKWYCAFLTAVLFGSPPMVPHL